MKSLWSSSVFLFVALVGWLLPGRALAADEVELQVARYFQSDTSGSCEACVTFNGTIEVENLDYQKSVRVVYRDPMFGDWRWIDATYEGPSEEGFEFWSFSEDLIGFDDIEFAVQYTVAGQTYWDSDGGRNLFVQRGVPLIGADDLQVVLTQDEAPLIRRFPDFVGYLGSVHLRNIAFEKDVFIRYTTDGWATWSDAPANYQWTESNGLERWAFSLELPLDTTRLEFAIGYEVEGVTYWDDDFGSNYSFDVP